MNSRALTHSLFSFVAKSNKKHEPCIKTMKNMKKEEKIIRKCESKVNSKHFNKCTT